MFANNIEASNVDILILDVWTPSCLVAYLVGKSNLIDRVGQSNARSEPCACVFRLSV